MCNIHKQLALTKYIPFAYLSNKEEVSMCTHLDNHNYEGLNDLIERANDQVGKNEAAVQRHHLKEFITVVGMTPSSMRESGLAPPGENSPTSQWESIDAFSRKRECKVIENKFYEKEVYK